MRPDINPDDVLRLFKRLGPETPYRDVAERLSHHYGLSGADAYGASNVALVVYRHRHEWDIEVGGQRVDCSPEFSAWPPLPVRAHDLSRVKFLRAVARVRTYGTPWALSETVRRKFLTKRDTLWSTNRVIRLDPNHWRMYDDDRNEFELEEDPGHARFNESRRSFCARHPDHC